MEHEIIIQATFFTVAFLSITCLFQVISSKWSSIPYTAALILAGFVTRYGCEAMGHPISLTLSPDLIYFILLPLLLFESSYHISIHSFRLQFHTINALATVGLLISVAIVTIVILLLTDLSFHTALLFGAIISSTDPISVIALFKQLGAPRRLALVADGESMLNDATSVIVFKLVAGIVLAGAGVNSNYVVSNSLTFIAVFVGSILYGIALGIIASTLIGKLKDNLLAMNLTALVIILFSFTSAEYFFSLSGVITTVTYGIVFGNLITPMFNHHQESAFHHFWEFIALISVSIVFFFSSFTLELSSLTASAPLWAPIILAVLIGRAVSVYAVCAATNNLSFFRYEPKIPLAWQHVLNWGGLRGVIPLVLAYSLPIDFASRDLMIALTMACFLFTLLINGTTIKPLLIFLGLHRPQSIEDLYLCQKNLMTIKSRLKKLESLGHKDFDRKAIELENSNLLQAQALLVAKITNHTEPEDLYRSFRMAGNKLERAVTKELFDKGYMDEQILYAFESQLNQQLDRVEYPNLPKRKVKKDFSFDTSTSWRNRIAQTLNIDPSNRILMWIFRASSDHLIEERFSLLQVRIITSQRALKYFSQLRDILKDHTLSVRAIDAINIEQQIYIHKNRIELIKLRRAFPKMYMSLQTRRLKSVLEDDNHLNLIEMEQISSDGTTNDGANLRPADIRT